MKHFGILFRLGSFWIGAHWSSENRRLCVNLVPCVTIWFGNPPAKSVWRCFHCNEVFSDPKEAATHFGTVQGASAVCTIKADEIRHMEWCLSKYRQEDTDLHQQIAHLQNERHTECQRAEEAGYAKGLRDGKLL